MSRVERLEDGPDPESSEETPLLPPPSEGVEASPSTAINGHQNGHSKPKHAPAREDGHTSANQKIGVTRTLLCTLALGFLIFLQATNISMLTTMQTAVASELDAYEKTTWFTSAYLIAQSSISPLNGKLAQVFSPRICIFTSTVVLAAGAIVTSVANVFEVFILGRVITGVGASGILTISIILVLELTGSKRRGVAIGLLNAGFTMGVAVGATAAGALLPTVGWRALFWMQAPISLVGGFILLLAIPHDFHGGKIKDSEQSTLQRLAQLDYLGAATLTAAIVLLLYALSSPKTIPVFPIILSALVLLTFVMTEINLATDPIIPVSLLKSRGLLLTCLGTVGYMMARWSVLFYTPTYALAVRQWKPVTAGSILLPTNLGFAIGGLLVGWLHIRRTGSFYIPSIVCYAIFPVTLIILAFISTADSAAWLYVLVITICGATTGAALNYNLAHLLHLTPKSTHYIATSLIATFRGFAGSFGSAVGGGLFTRSLYASLEQRFEDKGLRNREDLARRLLGSPALVENLKGVDKEVAMAGYQDALKVLFLSMAGLAVLMVLVQAGTGWEGAAEEGGQSRLEEEQRRLQGEENDTGRI